MYVSFYLLAINELDEVAETLKTTGFLSIEWKDEFLQWDPADYGGLDHYLFPQDDVWKPDVALKNSIEKYKSLGVSTLNVWVESTGNVYWYPFEVSVWKLLIFLVCLCFLEMSGKPMENTTFRKMLKLNIRNVYVI